MNKITVLIAGDNNFSNFVKHAVEHAERQNYNTLVYDLGDLGYGTKFEGKVSDITHQRIPSKPALILDGLSKIKEGDFLVWLDADTLLVDNIDEIIDDYDIGVTVRKKKSKRIQESFINAGVLFVRKSATSINFIEDWIKKTAELKGDQYALNMLCDLPNNNLAETTKVSSAVIKKFPCKVYNNFYFKGDQSQAKILHYKSDVRSYYPYKEKK